MNAQEIISSGILELYCSGLTSAAETAEVVQWAQQYPEVAAEIEAIQSSLEGYAQAHAIVPDASVKEKIFASINSNEKATPIVKLNAADNRSEKVYAISPVWKYAAAASIVLLIGSMALNVVLNNKYQSANKELASTQTELQQQIASAQSMDTAMRIMGDMHATQVVAKSIDTTADMGAKIYWMKNTSDVYIDPANLPKAPEGKQYEFWAIVEGAPVNGGVITTEINGKKVHVQKMKSFGKVQAFAISLENAGPAKTKPDKVMAVGSSI